MVPKPVPAPCAPPIVAHCSPTPPRPPAEAPVPVPAPDTQLVPQKRKATDDPDDPAPPAAPSSADLFDSGRVICESCGQSVLFRDESAAFTTKHWDAHRAQCAAAATHTASAADPAPPPPTTTTTTTTSTTTPDVPADPAQPNKRRRAKRSEEERIDYLRSDPYVAQFEPYRVLCASCDKWIRLRPNSTYCSIPWDAHRKSCLAKKGTKSAASDDRNAALLADPDVKKFDQERVHCRLCNKWVSIGADDHSLQSWSAHRAACQQSAGPAPPSVPPPSSHQLALASMSAPVRPPPTPHLPPSGSTTRAPKPATNSSPAAHAHTHTPSPPAPSHESRRRNAAQRAAQLRADPLLAAVEPARVFCTLCRKWVQLRQDSSFCAYPWQQHRAKCLLRHQRKAADAADRMPPSVTATVVPDGSGGGSGNSGGSPDSEPDADDSASEDGDGDGASRGAWASLEDAGDGDVEVDSGGGGGGGGGALSLADLDSPSGRVRFVARSLRHLFATTYERSDELTLAALVSYLNAAMPPDKHEDFDTAEVSRAALALHAAGAVALAGDVLRPAP